MNFHREDDYIRQPKISGYRGVHLVYRYLRDRQETYNGLSVEVQKTAIATGTSTRFAGES
jgi:ppGpp synthetase/RelA/SpoT-type nucleotidyltranferase